MRLQVGRMGNGITLCLDYHQPSGQRCVVRLQISLDVFSEFEGGSGRDKIQSDDSLPHFERVGLISSLSF